MEGLAAELRSCVGADVRVVPHGQPQVSAHLNKWARIRSIKPSSGSSYIVARVRGKAFSSLASRQLPSYSQGGGCPLSFFVLFPTEAYED